MNNFQKLVLGNTTEQRQIEFYLNVKPLTPFLYLLAGVHGDEPEGVYLLEKLNLWLHNITDLPYSLVIIPKLNLDGLVKNRRTNANLVDLNRNFPTHDWSPNFTKPRYFPGKSPLSEVENILLEKLFQTYHPNFMLSFHSWKPMINYNGDCESIAQAIHKLNNYPIHHDMGYPTPGSLGTYLLERYDCPSITFECPELEDQKDYEELWLTNETALKNIFLDQLLIKALCT